METQLLPGIAIRPARRDDADLFAEIHEEAARWLWSRGIRQWNPGTLPIEWVRRAIACGEMYTATERGEPVGFVMIQTSDDTWGETTDEAGYIHGLRVPRGAAGRGIGLALLCWAEREIAARGVRLARLDCMAENPVLCNYYERAGYRRVGSFTFHDGDEPFPVALFEKALGET